MLRLAQNGYDNSQVINALHAKHGTRHVKYRYDLLDNNNNYKKTLTTVLGGRISMAAFADIKRTASFTVHEDEDIDWLNDRIKPYFMLKIGDDWLEWPLGVFLLSTPSKTEAITVEREVEAYDLSQILIDDKFTERYTIASNTNYVAAVKAILTSAGVSKVNILSTSKVLQNTREFEIGATKLSAINKLLTEINYTQLIVDENGFFTSTPYISPSNRPWEYHYSDDELSVIMPGMAEELDLFGIPNKWVVVATNPETDALISVYTNSNPDSPTSTTSRGRTIVDYREIDHIADQTSLDAYVRRIAYNSSQIYGYVKFETANMPMHSYSNVLWVTNSRLGIDGKYSETNWDMDLSIGGSMSHEVRKVVNI